MAEQPESYWQQRGDEAALELFHQMSHRVPAYQKFLQQHDFDPASVKTIADFKAIPPISKDNYLRQFPRHELCWDGDIKHHSWVISTTSGSTGEPFYFPRQDEQDEQYALTAELYLRSNFKIHERSTLYVVAFPMGAWIGGVFTYEALKKVAGRGYNLSIITPGINKLEAIKAVKNLGADFDQVIIGSYAPFLKDIIDDGRAMGLNWKDYQLGFVFSAEGFNETFRDYVAKHTGWDNIYTDSLNHYGTVDLGTMSHETPLAVWLRRHGLENPDLYQALFSDVTKLPTLTQFLPEMFYFEDDNGSLYASAYSGLPLVRYDLKDRGGVFSLESINSKLDELGIDLNKELREAKIDDTVWNLPFVYVYERSDFSVSFFAFQIYPETIRKALQDESLEDQVTGKFTMTVRYDDQARQIFELHIELKAGAEDNQALRELVADLAMQQLLKENSEYRQTYDMEGEDRVRPAVLLYPYEHPEHFRPGTKQKWVKQ